MITWVAFLLDQGGSDPAVLRRTVLVGHSVGCQAVLRYLAALPAGALVRDVLLVAGWWTVDRPWETLRPWLDTPLDLARVRAATPSVTTLLSDNDPFTADVETNRSEWQDRVGARVVVVPGAAHFNSAREPSVLAQLLHLAKITPG